MKPNTILIYEDRPLFKTGLAKEFKNGLSKLQCHFVSAFDEIKVYRQNYHLPRVFLFRLKPFPDRVLDYALDLKRSHSFTRVAAFIDLQYKSSLHRLLHTGMDGYFTREVSLSELEKGLVKIAGGQNYCQSSLAEELHLQQGILKKHSAKREALEASLTVREMEVISLMARDYSTCDMADALCLSKRTVEGHRLRIIEKTRCRSALGVVRLALKMEWVDNDGEQAGFLDG